MEQSRRDTRFHQYPCRLALCLNVRRSYHEIRFIGYQQLVINALSRATVDKQRVFPGKPALHALAHSDCDLPSRGYPHIRKRGKKHRYILRTAAQRYLIALIVGK